MKIKILRKEVELNNEEGANKNKRGQKKYNLKTSKKQKHRFKYNKY